MTSMAGRDPLLSVIVPLYNERSTVRELLKRVLAQPMSKEIIVVDDRSTDGCTDLVAELAQREPAIRLIRQETNQGKGAAVRRGIEEARGEIVLIQDADLEYDPRDYAKLIQPIVGRRCRRRVRLALRRPSAPGDDVLAHGREPLPDLALEHHHQSQPHRHGDLLQGLPPGDHPVHPPALAALRLRAGSHGQDRPARLPHLRSADLVSRPRLLGREEDRLEGRRQRRLDDLQVRPLRARRLGSGRLRDAGADGQALELQRLDLAEHRPVRRQPRARSGRRHRQHDPRPLRSGSHRGHRSRTALPAHSAQSLRAQSDHRSGPARSQLRRMPGAQTPRVRHGGLPQRPRAHRGSRRRAAASVRRADAGRPPGALRAG